MQIFMKLTRSQGCKMSARLASENFELNLEVRTVEGCSGLLAQAAAGAADFEASSKADETSRMLMTLIRL